MHGTPLKLLAIVVGAAFWAVSLVGILLPHGFVSGGVSGIVLILYYLLEWPPVGLAVLMLNIPLFAAGWKIVSRRFFGYSLAAMLVYSLLVEVLPRFTIPVHDKMLAALFAGVLGGIGSGIVYRAGGSGGGTEILAVILNRKLSFRVGAVSFAVNTAILMVGAAVLGLEPALYSMVKIFVAGTVLDKIIGGFNQRKSVIVISAKHEAIAEAILHELHRGVTRIPAEGAYTRSPRTVLYTVVALTEMARLKEIVLGQDRGAFVTILPNLEVIGHGFQTPEALAPPIFGTGQEPRMTKVAHTAS